MKLTLLGTVGPMPDPTRHGSATVIQVGGAHLLFDTGCGVVLQLARAGIPIEKVHPVFIQSIAADVGSDYDGPVVLGTNLTEITV